MLELDRNLSAGEQKNYCDAGRNDGARQMTKLHFPEETTLGASSTLAIRTRYEFDVGFLPERGRQLRLTKSISDIANELENIV